MVLKINRFGYEYSISVGLATTVKSGSEDAAASLMPATVRLAIKTQTPVPDGTTTWPTSFSSRTYSNDADEPSVKVQPWF
jgi:hypothetical protein